MPPEEGPHISLAGSTAMKTGDPMAHRWRGSDDARRFAVMILSRRATAMIGCTKICKRMIKSLDFTPSLICSWEGLLALLFSSTSCAQPT